MTIEKTWIATSRNPRPSHSDVSGETVKAYEEFGNGLQYPGDGDLGPEEVANCRCIMYLDGSASAPHLPRLPVDPPRLPVDPGDLLPAVPPKPVPEQTNAKWSTGLQDDEE